MADTMQFDLVSPERSLASLAATAVQLPGAEGDMTAMPDHAPVITTLRPGIVRVQSPEGDAEFVVSGGFAEVTASSASVLAERALPVGEVTQAVLDDMIAAVAALGEGASAGDLDSVAKQTAEIAAMAAELGLSVNTAG